MRDRLLNPFKVGELHDLSGLQLKVVAVNDESVPIAIELSYTASLDEKNLNVYYWQQQKLQPLNLAIGESREFK